MQNFNPQVQERIHEIQKEAYMKLLRVLCVKPLDWRPDVQCAMQGTEDLLTDIRSLLNISNEEHSGFMKDCRPGGKLSLTPSSDMSRSSGLGMGRGSMPPMGGNPMMMGGANQDILQAHQSFAGKLPDVGMGGGMPGLGGSQGMGSYPY